MPLVNLKDMLGKAKAGKYAVGAFNVYNVEDITAVIAAAEEVRSPVILMTSSMALKHTTIEDLAGIVRRRAKIATIPVCLHLDHASDYDTIIKAMYADYTSVMYDGSI